MLSLEIWSMSSKACTTPSKLAPVSLSVTGTRLCRPDRCVRVMLVRPCNHVGGLVVNVPFLFAARECRSVCTLVSPTGRSEVRLLMCASVHNDVAVDLQPHCLHLFCVKQMFRNVLSAHVTAWYELITARKPGRLVRRCVPSWTHFAKAL
jgi:hypothetical protein